jgi:hypothetical protein
MNEFPLFFRFIGIKIGRKVAESSDIILPRPKKLFSTTRNVVNESKVACYVVNELEVS